MSEDMDLSHCDREPIHIPGAIQPHGALLALEEPGLRVIASSTNAASMLGIAGDLSGAPLAKILDESSHARLVEALRGNPRDASPIALTLRDGRSANGLAHRSEGLLLLEFEPAGDDDLRFRTAYRRLVRRFDRLRRTATLDEVCDLAAQDVQALTGFDRVMVYRFEPDGSGAVIAERRVDESLDSYLGLHYPASDIPPQARELYIRNPLRLIVDASFTPVPVVPAINPLTGGPIDLSLASLRSVSPVHCEYLRNMGVAASMSISLLYGEELWGLIACHHYRPYHVPYGTRLIAEFFAHVLSARIVELDRIEALTNKTQSYAVQSRLIDEMVSAPRFQDGLRSASVQLDDLLDCDGAAVLYRGEVTSVGTTPAPNEIRALGAALAHAQPNKVLATDNIASLHAPAERWVDQAAGVIAVPISADGADLIFWFRRERLRSVTWAGDPDKPAALQKDGRLHPRASFKAWTEQVRGHSRPWAEWELEVATDFRTALVASIIHQAAELERLNTRLLQASRTKDEFLATVSHELRNPLNAILGWVRIARSGLDGEELSKALATIERNAVAQTELIDDLLDIGRIQSGRLALETTVMDLGSLVAQAIETVTPTANSRGIDIRTQLDATSAEVVGDRRRLQQVIWNLLTNAIKFSDEGKAIDVALERGDSVVSLTIRDQGIGIDAPLLPQIFEPFRQGETRAKRSGLGLGLSIVRSIVDLHNGAITAHSDGPGQGAAFVVSLPVAALSADVRDAEARVPQPVLDFDGLQMLVVEDNPDAAEMIATLLSNQGASVRLAANGREALRCLEEQACDVVLSDLDMPELDGFGLVRAMARKDNLRNIPAIALTAFARGGDRARALSAGFRQHVAKPVDPEELMAVVASIVGRL